MEKKKEKERASIFNILANQGRLDHELFILDVNILQTIIHIQIKLIKGMFIKIKFIKTFFQPTN
jgi:hypothetical protein